MEQQVQLADGQGSQVALLAVQRQVAGIAAPFPDILGGVNQHSGGTGGGVADAHTFLWFQQLHDESHDLARGVELAAFLAGVVGELVDEILVGVSQHVASAAVVATQVGVPKVQVTEVVNQAANDALPVGRAAQLCFVVPVGAHQHSVQPGRVGILDGVAGIRVPSPFHPLSQPNI